MLEFDKLTIETVIVDPLIIEKEPRRSKGLVVIAIGGSVEVLDIGV